MKRIIVTADDFGLTEAINHGIIEAHVNGLVTAASLMASAEAFGHAVELCKQYPRLDLGIHLTLVEEFPVLTGLKTLVGPDGRFHNRGHLIWLLLTNQIDFDEVKACLRAQITKCLDTGIPVSFINGHAHVHMFPSLLPIVARLSAEFHIPAVRKPVERFSFLSFRESGLRGVLKNTLITVSSEFSLRRTGASLRTTDAFLGLSCSGHLTEDRLTRFLKMLPSGITEIMTHPGRADRHTNSKYGHWGYHWDTELDALMRVKFPVDQLTTFRAEFRKDIQT